MIDIQALQQSEDFRTPPEGVSLADWQRGLLQEAMDENMRSTGLHPEGAAPLQLTPQVLSGNVPEQLPPGRIQPSPALPPVPVPFAADTRPAGSLPRPTGSGVLPTIGGAIGQGTALVLAPPSGGMTAVTLPAFSAAGSAAGLTLESILSRGRFPSWQEIATEAGLSLAPDVLESGGKALSKVALRKLIKTTNLGGAGQIFRQSEQYDRALAGATGVFNAPTKEEVDHLFTTVREIGPPLPTNELARTLASRQYTPGQRTALASLTARMDAIINQRLGRPGSRRFQDLYERMRLSQMPPKPGEPAVPAIPPQPSTILDASGQPMMHPGIPGRPEGPSTPPPMPPTTNIGDLQDLRSATRALSEQMGPSNPHRDLLVQFRMDIDRTVDLALFDQGAGRVGLLLTQARQAYHRFAAAEDLSEMMVKHSHYKTVGTKNRWQLDVNGLFEEIYKNQSMDARNMIRHLDTIQGSWGNLAKLERDVGKLNFFVDPDMGSPGVRNLPFMPTASRAMAEILLSNDATNRLIDHALRNGGQITANYLSQAISILRREQYPAQDLVPAQAQGISNEDLLATVRQLLGSQRPSPPVPALAPLQ